MKRKKVVARTRRKRQAARPRRSVDKSTSSPVRSPFCLATTAEGTVAIPKDTYDQEAASRNRDLFVDRMCDPAVFRRRVSKRKQQSGTLTPMESLIFIEYVHRATALHPSETKTGHEHKDSVRIFERVRAKLDWKEGRTRWRLFKSRADEGGTVRFQFIAPPGFTYIILEPLEIEGTPDGQAPVVPQAPPAAPSTSVPVASGGQPTENLPAGAPIPATATLGIDVTAVRSIDDLGMVEIHALIENTGSAAATAKFFTLAFGNQTAAPHGEAPLCVHAGSCATVEMWFNVGFAPDARGGQLPAELQVAFVGGAVLKKKLSLPLPVKHVEKP